MKPYFEPLPVIYSLNGGVAYLPQDTMESFGAGFEEGADAAGITVQLSSDGELMVISSEVLEKVSNGSGPVKSHSAAVIKSFDAAYRFTIDGEFTIRGKGYRFITLDELLAAFPEKKFSIVLMHKDDKLVNKYAAVVKGMNAQDRVLTSSLYGSNIKGIRKLLPGSATSFSMTGIVGVYGLFKSGLIYFSGGFTADALQTAEYIGASYIANRGLVRSMHKRGVWVQVWDVRDEVQYQRLVSAGVDSFMTEDVPALKGFMNR